MLEDTHVQPQKLMPIMLKRKKKLMVQSFKHPLKNPAKSKLSTLCLFDVL